MNDQGEGKIGQLMTEWFGRSWRTSLSGFLTLGTGVAIAIISKPEGETLPITLIKAAPSLLTGIGLMQAKDAGVSGLARGR